MIFSISCKTANNEIFNRFYCIYQLIFLKAVPVYHSCMKKYYSYAKVYPLLVINVCILYVFPYIDVSKY